MSARSRRRGKLPELIDFQEGPGILAKDFRATGVPLIRLSGLDRGANSLLDGCNFLDPLEVSRRWDHFRVSLGDTLLSTSASLGRIGVVDEGAVGAIPYTGIIRMRPRDNRIRPAFIRYLLESPDFQIQVEAMGVGSVIRHFGPSHLREMTLPILDLGDQDSIVSILGAIDDKIKVNFRTGETLEAMALALFRSWFVDFDPVRARVEGRAPVGMDAATAALFPDSFEGSELGDVPRGWRVGTLGELARSVRRLVDPREVSGEVAYIGLEHMPRRSIVLYDWESANKVTSTKTRFERGQVLFGKLRPYFHKVVVAPVAGICSTDIIVVAPRSEEGYGLVLGHLSSDEVIQYSDRCSTGTKMPRVSWDDLARFRVVLPPKEVAARHSAIVQPLIEKMIWGIHESRTLAELRDRLLPKLLSGELRVGDAEKVVGQVA